MRSSNLEFSGKCQGYGLISFTFIENLGHTSSTESSGVAMLLNLPSAHDWL
jgi:hypothetical protein